MMLLQIFQLKKKKTLKDASKDLSDWLNLNPNARVKDLIDKFEKINEIVEPIINRAETKYNLGNLSKGLKSRGKDNDLEKLPKEEKIK